VLLMPTFHGDAYSVRVELEEKRSAAELTALLEGAGVPVAHAPPTLLDALEEQSLRAHVVPSGPARSHWLWAVSDSMGAGAAQEIVRQVERLAGRVPVLRSVE
jgi:hypothetical protein